MWTQRMVGVGVAASGLGLRASRDGLLRVSGAGSAGRRQQRQASGAEVSAERSTVHSRSDRPEGNPGPQGAMKRRMKG